MSKRILHQWLSHPMQTLKQGSTLAIRSKVKRTKVVVRSQWRDDGHLSMLSRVQANPGGDVDLTMTEDSNQMTSLGREESYIRVDLMPKETVSSDLEANESSPSNPLATSIVSYHPDSESDIDQGIDYSEEIAQMMKDWPQHAASSEIDTMIAIDVPEKVNIDCDLTEGGAISIPSKIEGDIRLSTRNGNITVQKLRGHAIDIEAHGTGNTIHATDLVEAETLRVTLPATGRFRSKRVHASSCSVEIGTLGELPQAEEVEHGTLLDDDDGGAMCDISSLYVTEEANVNVISSVKSMQAVRVKSHHGHATVQATSPIPQVINAVTGEKVPVVDMGGVNGSCEVFIHKNGSADESGISCQVHFDSISPDSASIIKADKGSVHVTIDRKVESDLRLLSSSDMASVDVDTMLASEDDEDYDELRQMLEEIDGGSKKTEKAMIQIGTQAFSEKESDAKVSCTNCEFVDGWVENKSSEPDSRFDRKHKGEMGSVGKIRLEGAADQALHGFSGTSESNWMRPIVVVASAGEIFVETLSWLGNIARRYGLDDKRGKDELGRTATRRGRLLDPPTE